MKKEDIMKLANLDNEAVEREAMDYVINEDDTAGWYETDEKYIECVKNENARLRPLIEALAESNEKLTEALIHLTNWALEDSQNQLIKNAEQAVADYYTRMEKLRG